MENYCRVGQATDGNMTHAHCSLDNSSYRHTLRIYNTYFFRTTTMVARTRLIVTLYVHCLSGSFWFPFYAYCNIKPTHISECCVTTDLRALVVLPGQARPCEICGGQRGGGTGFSPSVSIMLPMYHNRLLLSL